MKIVYNRLLGGWYVVRGKHQTPLSGRFETKQDAELYLRNKQNRQENKVAPWYAKGEVGEYLIHALDLIQDGQINDAISACLSVGMSDEEIDEFLAAEGVAQ